MKMSRTYLTLTHVRMQHNWVQLPYTQAIFRSFMVRSASAAPCCNVCFRLAVRSFNPAHEWPAEDEQS